MSAFGELDVIEECRQKREEVADLNLARERDRVDPRGEIAHELPERRRASGSAHS